MLELDTVQADRLSSHPQLLDRSQYFACIQEATCKIDHRICLERLFSLTSNQFPLTILQKQGNGLLSSIMADFRSHGDGDGNDPNVSSSSTSRARRKLGKTGSKWFNKSFDQTVLQQATKPAPPRTMRRQNSVTDFFQNMLSKSKSHLQDIFTSKKDKSKHQKFGRIGTPDRQTPIQAPANDEGEVEGAQGGLTDQEPEIRLHSDMKNLTLHSSCPSFSENVEGLAQQSPLNPQINLRPDPNATGRERRISTEKARLASPTSLSTTMNMFVVTRPDNFRSKSEDAEVDYSAHHRPLMKKSSLPFSPPCSDQISLRQSLVSSMASPGRRKLQHSPSSPGRYRAPKIVTLSSHDSSDSADEGPLGRRNVSSAPPGRQSVCSASALLATDDFVSRTKRALVKSNSDTFAKLSSSPQPLVKASSDGNCFKKSPASSLANSMTSLGNVMISVTDYLFMGSIEAAYNEPLLCKYGISSLVDMTNINPILVPPHKKSDCPCACVNKTHFRSKLNIGVDDIEWENLEQYFEEINAFIHGARKKGRRVLVFSYMGQSRAAAAAIQHLMHHFRMPYREALNIVRAKRPQVKLNSGFVKALLRLEKHLGLENVRKGEEPTAGTKPVESPMVARGSVEEINTLSAPPVVRGAWLEC